MRRVRLRRASHLAVVAALGAACSARPTESGATKATLRDGVVAIVAGDAIQAETVARIAAARAIEPHRALEAATFDALLAAEQRTRKPELGQRRRERYALVRTLLETIDREARDEGPISDAEVEVLAKPAWFEVARPEAVKSVHAVVRVPDDANEARWKEAEALAAKIVLAVEPAVLEAQKTPAPPLWQSARPLVDSATTVFIERASAVERGTFEVVTQELDPVAADGLTVQPEGRSPYDPQFVRVVRSLTKRGELTAPFRSAFGVHVAMFLQRTEARELAPAEYRSRFESEALRTRVKARTKAILEAATASTDVAKELNADALLDSLKLGP
jgi:peptidyl-prolyl cis-trans isomerase C